MQPSGLHLHREVREHRHQLSQNLLLQIRNLQGPPCPSQTRLLHLLLMCQTAWKKLQLRMVFPQEVYLVKGRLLSRQSWLQLLSWLDQ